MIQTAKPKKRIWDVFLSHGARDIGMADLVLNALRRAGLAVYTTRELRSGESIGDSVRVSLAESHAVVLLLTPSVLESRSLAFEVGAAMAWNKPVYILFDGLSLNEIPVFLKQCNIHPVNELDKVAHEIAASRKPLSDNDRQSLVNAYKQIGVPTDQLLRQPTAVQDLSSEFKKLTRSSLSGERLVQELIRLRKQGKLPRLLRTQT